ncbi:hypothetical protein BCR42DRAFT_436322 [Absidia repens]|uniref:Uncharacterized protein n=1 Tax=Absidia repens TaxID=90262 RepID=A0A1X2IMK4_9FUNG|nr:hypothetical protein BCR42DRAFT_436322 [Absidia repens]
MEQQWNQLRRYQRRLRIKNHRQKHQHRQLINGDNEDRDNVLADLAMASTAFSTPSKKRNENGKHQSISSLPLTNPCQLPPQSAVATTSPVALSLKPVHPHQLEVASTIPLPSPPLSPMSFSCTCRSPSSQEKGYHHDNEDTLSLSSYSRYEFISDDGKSDTSDDGQYHQHYQKTSSPSSPSSLSAHHPLSSSSDETNDWHPQNSSDAAFDDTMDMLDQMAQDGYDEHFFQDMAFLLDHPDICSQPLADLAPLLEQQHHHLENGSSDDKKDRRVTSPSGWAHGPSSVSTTSPYIQHLCSSGWQWYRFVSILSASYVVSLLKGPDDLLED